MNKVLRRNIKSSFKICPSVENLVQSALQGQEKKHWYKRARARIKKAYGKDWKKFIGVLSATSPRQSVELNLAMARKVFALYEFLGKDLTRQDIAEIVDLPCRVDNTLRALHGIALSGNKVESFRQNLIGNSKAVTIDTWMIAFAGVQYESKFLNKSGYLSYSHRIRRAGKVLKWKPCEVQAGIWAHTYAKVNKCEVKDVPEFELQTKGEN